jgi:excisionase family DNA binding protein
MKPTRPLVISSTVPAFSESGTSPPLLTVKQLAEFLQIPRKTIYRWTSRREIPFIVVGKHRRFILLEVIEHFKRKTLAQAPCANGSKLLQRVRQKRSLKNERRIASSLSQKGDSNNGNR